MAINDKPKDRFKREPKQTPMELLADRIAMRQTKAHCMAMDRLSRRHPNGIPPYMAEHVNRRYPLARIKQ